MTRRFQTPLLAAVAAMLVLLLVVNLRGAATPSATPHTASIAVADIQKILGSLDEKSAAEADITAATEKLQKEEQDRQQELKALDADLRILNENADAYKQTRDKLEQKAIEFQTWKQFKARQMEANRTARIEQLYGKIIDAIGRIAKKSGYDIVLYKDQFEHNPNQNQQQIALNIQIRKVLYVSPEFDLTAQVTQMLNNEYNNRKAAQRAGGK